MCNSEFSESLSNALFSQLKDVFTVHFFDFLFNIKPSTLVLVDKTRRLFEVLSVFLLLSLLFCLLSQRHNKLLDRPLIHSLSRLWAIRSRDVSKASWSLLQTFFMLRCSEAVAHSSLFEQREHDCQVHFFQDLIVNHFALPFDIK